MTDPQTRGPDGHTKDCRLRHGGSECSCQPKVARPAMPILARLHGQCGLHIRGHKPGQCMICDAADEIEALRAALKVAQQSLLEFSHAQECGPSWYTRGENGMYQIVHRHLRLGLEAVRGALGPYDDNGQYLKEKADG